MSQTINTAVIGALGNMQRWFAKHVPADSSIKFTSMFGSNNTDGKRGEALEYWKERGAVAVERGDYESLTSGANLVLICAGKHLEATKIYPPLVAAMKQNGSEGDFPATIVDFSTYSPGGSRVISEFCAENGIRWAGVPLSGGPGGAENASMIMMYGGPQEIWDDLNEPLFQHVGNPTNYGIEPDAGAKIKMIGQRMVFGQHLGLCGAIAMESESFRSGEIGGASQTERIEILNGGAGGGVQWQKALAIGIRDDVWTDLGFLNPHAAADAIYAAMFADSLGLSRHTVVNPLLLTAATLGFTMKEHGLNSATQAMVKTMLADGSADLDSYLDNIGFLQAKTTAEAAELVTNSLPPEVSPMVLPNLTIKDFRT